MTGAEVLIGTVTVPITCTISGVTTTPTVSWKQETTAITDDNDYDIGDIKLTGNTASAVLTVVKASDTDTTYTCVVTSTEWEKSNEEHTVNLNVYGNNLYNLSIAESL